MQKIVSLVAHILFMYVHIGLMTRFLLILQPHTLNVQASVDARSAELAKIQAKINKVEDEVYLHHIHLVAGGYVS